MQLVLLLEDCGERVSLLVSLGSLEVGKDILIEWIWMRGLIRRSTWWRAREDRLRHAWESCMNISYGLWEGRGEAALLIDLEILTLVYLLNLKLVFHDRIQMIQSSLWYFLLERGWEGILLLLENDSFLIIILSHEYLYFNLVSLVKGSLIWTCAQCTAISTYIIFYTAS